MENVVLGHPYDGGLYYLLSRGNPWGAPSGREHPYYAALYGADPLSAAIRAVNLAVLFETVLLPPADDYLPDRETYTNGGVYEHPDLRVRVKFDWLGLDSAQAIAERLARDETFMTGITEAMHVSTELFPLVMLVHRTIQQLQLALETDAVLLGGSAVELIARGVLAHTKASSDAPSRGPRILSMSADALQLIGLDWKCSDLQTFAAVRQSGEIRSYAQGFRTALLESSGAANCPDLRSALIARMREAMDHEEVARKAKGAFETTGIVSTIAGAVPVLGTVATLAGLSSTLANKKATRSEEGHRWYLLGPKMREIELKQALRDNSRAHGE